MKSTKHRKKEKIIIINIVHEILLKVLQLFRTQMAATKFFILKKHHSYKHYYTDECRPQV